MRIYFPALKSLRKWTLVAAFLSLGVLGQKSELLLAQAKPATKNDASRQQEKAESKPPKRKPPASKVDRTGRGKTKTSEARPDFLKASTPIAFTFRSVIQDNSGKPVSGVFPLEFSLLEHDAAAVPLWREKQYVAVVSGEYSIVLGGARNLPVEVFRRARYVGVSLGNEGEILRDRLVPDQVLSTAHGDEAKTTRPASSTNKQGRRAYADVADRASFAEKAKLADSAEKVGEWTQADIEAEVSKVLDKLGEHVADPQAHAAAGSLSLGDERRVMDPTGGSGGSEFRINCPKGHVVTGIEGGSGRVIDRVTVVCQPLR